MATRSRDPTGSSTDVGAPSFWLLTTDRRIARLLQASMTSQGRLHVEEKGTITESWEELQHGRPSPRSGKDGHTYASLGHEDDERIRRFARRVAGWVEAEMEARRIPRLHVFASRRLLGELRKLWPEELGESLAEHALDLAHLSPGDLAKHEAVVTLCELDEIPESESP